MKQKLFGEVAVEKGYITAAQLTQALIEQDRICQDEQRYRFVGEILVELGHMSDRQVLDVLSVVHEGNLAC